MNVFESFVNLFDKNGNLRDKAWVEWKHELNVPAGHCELCKVLHECWFDNQIKPKKPLHPKCHCTTVFIEPPKANVTSEATCDIRKFTEYIFSDKYAWNGKRALFENLGFSIADAEFLKREYEKQASEKYCNSDYSLGKLDKNGQRININIEFNRNGNEISFLSGWMVKPKGFISNNTPFGG